MNVKQQHELVEESIKNKFWSGIEYFFYRSTQIGNEKMLLETDNLCGEAYYLSKTLRESHGLFYT